MSIMRDEAKVYVDAIRPAIAVVVVAFVLLMSSAITCRSQEIGDVRAGFDYARRVCAECHAILATSDPSPVAKATPFRIVANTPGMTGTAIAVWLRTPHPTMPNLIVRGDDLENLVAYILGLRVKQ